MIIALTSQKGGVGKSTLATNIAVALSLEGKDVLLVDADPQSTSTRWSNERADRFTETPLIHAVQKYGRIKPALIDLGKRYSYVIVDCQGRESEEMRTALFAADVAIIPIRCSQPDLDTLATMNLNVEEAWEVNPGLRPYVLLSMVPTNPVIKEEDGARRLLSRMPLLRLLEARICDRKSYRDAMIMGAGVVELDGSGGKAKAEILDLIKELDLGIQRPDEDGTATATQRGGNSSSKERGAAEERAGGTSRARPASAKEPEISGAR